MEGNDLGSYWSKKFIVIAEPTIFELPDTQYRLTIGQRQYGKRKTLVEDMTMNHLMVSWIVNVGRMRNIPTEIWTFITDDEIVEYMSERLERVAGNALVGWQQWPDEADAVLELRVDPSIHTVYDADPDRVERLWGMRGHRVLRGGAPTS